MAPIAIMPLRAKFVWFAPLIPSDIEVVLGRISAKVTRFEPKTILMAIGKEGVGHKELRPFV